MISAKDVRKSYDSIDVLKGIDLEVQEGQIVSIVGASGAGKSTLLHILGTLDKADSGEVSIHGESYSHLSGKSLAAFRNRHIGFVFQFHNLLPEFSALENVSIPGFIAKTAESQVKKRGMELLDFLGIADRAKHKPSEMSGGEQQRVAIARALINSPSVLLADEPTGNLDSENSELMYELFQSLRSELNQTFLIVTHDMSLAKTTDRQLTMSDGVFVS